MSKILFSPISQVDPIATNTFRDGSLLHICRFEKPDIIYLYVSEEMKPKEKACFYCINQLYEDFNIEKPEIKKLYSSYNSKDAIADYDKMYDEVSNIFNAKVEYKQNDIVILNITSGTKQLVTAICILYATNYIKCKEVIPIQAITPQKKHNRFPNIKYYPYKTLWKMNLDNLDASSINRLQYPKLNYKGDNYAG